MAYGSASYLASKNKDKSNDLSHVTSSNAGQKNRGDIIGGIGYVGGSFAAGVGSIAEGIIDLGVAGVSSLFGDTETAENAFKNNVVGDWHEDLTEDYNPGGMMQFIGDVSHGLGQSSWMLLSMIPGAQWVGPVVTTAGYIGQGISGAADKTGEVGLKEVAYGTTTGLAEGALDTLLGATYKGVKTLGKSVFKTGTKEAAKTLAKEATRKGLVKTVLSDAAGEFAEEFLSEYLDTFLQRAYQVDPDAQYSLKNALYAGTVGFVSGSVSSGGSNISSAAINQRRGAKIVKNGNDQTLVNTATYVADKLAASGTNFKNTAEWIRILRGDVDAYNKLTDEQKKGMRGQTILGEMQAALYFAEMQTVFHGAQDRIQNADEQKRATWAEQINKTVDSDKRKKDYTAADIAKNTDNIAWQLAVMQFVGEAYNIDGAAAAMQTEEGIKQKIAEYQTQATGNEAAQGAPVTNESAPIVNNVTTAPEVKNVQVAGGEKIANYSGTDTTVSSETTNIDKMSLDKKSQIGYNEKRISKRQYAILSSELARKNGDSPRSIEYAYTDSHFYVVDNNRLGGFRIIASIPIEPNQEKITLITKGIDNETYGNRRDVNKWIANVRRRKRFSTGHSGNAGHGNSTGSNDRLYVQSSSSKARGITAEGSRDIESKQELEKSDKLDLASASGTENKSPTIKKPKEALTDKQRVERAKKESERILEFGKESEPTVKELNTLREYVKGFDNLEITRRMAIVRMLRTAEGVDSKIVKGVANLMAMTTRSGKSVAPDLEFRFAKGISDRGVYTHVGDKTVVLINSDTDFSKTIRGTIAHELVHYIENREGYKDLADYVMKTAKQEKKDEIRKEYEEHYKEVYVNGYMKQGLSEEAAKKKAAEIMATAEFKALINSEIVARLVGERLLDEKFLNRYAQKDDKLIKKLGRFVKATVSALKDKDPESSRIAAEIANKFNNAIQSAVSSVNDDVTSKYEIKNTKSGGRVVWIEDDVLKGNKLPTHQAVANYLAQHIGDVYTIVESGQKVYLGKDLPLEYTQSEYTKKLLKRPSILKAKNKALPNLGEMIEIATNRRWAKDKGSGKKDAKYGVYKYDTCFAFPVRDSNGNTVRAKAYDATLIIINSSDGKKYLYDLTAIKENTSVSVDLSARETMPADAGQKRSVSNNSIPQKSNLSTVTDKKDIKNSTTNIDKLDLSPSNVDAEASNNAIQSEVVGESKETKTAFDISNATPGYINAKVNTKIVQLANNVENNNYTNDDKIDLGKILPKLAMKIQELTGIDVKNFRVVLEPRMINHILLNHGKKGKRDRTMADYNNIAKLEYAMNNYDDISLGKTTSAYKNIVNGKTQKAKTILYEKSIGNKSYYVVQAVPDSKTKTLFIVSTFIGEKGYKKEALQFANTKNPGATSEIETANTSNTSIPQKSNLSTDTDKKDIKNSTTNIDKLDLAPKGLKQQLAAEQKKTQKLRERLAKEEAKAARLEKARTYSKKEVYEAIKLIKSLTVKEIRSLGNGYELRSMTGARRDQLISSIYIALHEESAHGYAGKGSAAVKILAAKLAYDIVQSSSVVDGTGKVRHISDVYDEASVQRMTQSLTEEIYNIFADMGAETKNAQFLAKLRAIKQAFRAELETVHRTAKLARGVTYQANKLKEMVEHQERSMEDQGIQKVTKMLSSVVDAKGNLKLGNVDEAIAEAGRFYTMEGGKLGSESKGLPENASLTDFALEIDGDLQFMIEEFQRLRQDRKKKALNEDELSLLVNILAGMRSVINQFNKIYVEGRWVDVDEKAGETIEDLHSYAGTQKEYNNKVFQFLDEKLATPIKQGYFYNIISPETTIEALEGYKKDGMLKTLYHSIRTHKQKAEHLAVKMKKPFAEYLDSRDEDHIWINDKGRKRTYRQKLNEKVINVNGYEITLGEAIYLYMLTKREHAHIGLKKGGFITFDENNQRKQQFKILDIEATRDFIYGQFDAADIAFLKMAEDFFNKTSTEVKKKADMEIFGYTNIEGGYYVPIIRDRYSRNAGVTDIRQSIKSHLTVYNKSFNQNTIENAKALEGKNIMAIINDHADGLADYAELYLPLKSFDRFYNRRILRKDGEITSVREVLQNEVWNGTEKYLRDLFADIQGQGSSGTSLDALIGKTRSGWVSSVLGLNLKVIVTQTTSYVAANQVIEAKYLIPALQKFVGNQEELGKRADEYSDIIEARGFEMGSLKAQGNIDKITEIGKKTGLAIEWMDRRVCLAIFHAAELKAEASGHGPVGSESNARAAAKIADEVIYTTQAMSGRAEKSALQRSKSEVAKTFSMFTSDSVKQLSHFYGNVMKYLAHKERAKTDATYEAALEKDKKAVGRSAATLAMTGVMLGVITQAFKYLYAQQEEEPEDKIKDFAMDIFSSTINILPIVSDLADKFVFDYDLSLNSFDIAEDVIEDTAGLISMANRAMGGEYVSGNEVGKRVINFVKTLGTVTGIPVAPVERTVTGLLRRFSPSLVYGYDAIFSNPAYTADLKSAVESGDERLAENILLQLYKNEISGAYTSEELSEIARLYQITDENGKHYDVLPHKIGDEINGVKLTRSQRKRFESIYAQASDKVNELIRSAAYQALTDEQRARAIKNIYALYYNRASAEVAGAEWTNAQAYWYLTDNYTALFASQAYKSGLAAYVDNKGKEVSVKKQFVDYVQNIGLSEQDYLVVMYANGYRDEASRLKLVGYINSLSLSSEVKARIAARLGFGFKDGRVIDKEK